MVQPRMLVSLGEVVTVSVLHFDVDFGVDMLARVERGQIIMPMSLHNLNLLLLFESLVCVVK